MDLVTLATPPGPSCPLVTVGSLWRSSGRTSVGHIWRGQRVVEVVEIEPGRCRIKTIAHPHLRESNRASISQLRWISTKTLVRDWLPETAA